jgi:hypothetical protein
MMNNNNKSMRKNSRKFVSEKFAGIRRTAFRVGHECPPNSAVGKNSDNADANKIEGKRLPKKQTSREIRNPVEAADEMVGKAAASQDRTEALARGVRSSWVVKGRRRRCRGVAYLGRRERRVRLAGGRAAVLRSLVGIVGGCYGWRAEVACSV